MLTRCCQVVEAHFLTWAPAFFPRLYLCPERPSLSSALWGSTCRHSPGGGGRLARDLPWPSFSPCLWPSPKVLEFESHWARLPFDLIPSCVRISFITYLLGDTRMNKVPFLPLELFNKVEEWPSPDMALWSAGDVVVKEQTVGDQGSLPRGGNNRNELMRMKRTWSGEKVEAERGRREF